MNDIFADTAYFLALLNTRDHFHSMVQAASRQTGRRLVTTAWVFAELLDALRQPENRIMTAGFVRNIADRGDIIVVPPTQALFDAGLRFYADRPDKDWSFTDCISFVVMRQQGLTEALTADRHFEQAGFKVLLK